MDMIFNELSTQPVAENRAEGLERVDALIKTFKRAKKFNFNKIRFEEAIDQITLSHDYTLNNFCSDYRDKGMLLRGLAKYPFIDEDSEEENRYCVNNFSISKNGESIATYGLATAWLYATIGIGFASETFWGNFEFELSVSGEETQTTTVLCASNPEHFNSGAFSNWQDTKNINRLAHGETLTVLFNDYDFNQQAQEDILFWITSRAVTLRLYKLLKDIKYNPFTGGIGKTEPLKNHTDTYSKRIDDANRLVYQVITDRKIIIQSCRGHYGDR